jgi:hypothetical protein
MRDGSVGAFFRRVDPTFDLVPVVDSAGATWWVTPATAATWVPDAVVAPPSKGLRGK